MLGVAWALKLLQVVPQVIAAAPEFKSIWDQLVHTYSGADQQDLQAAYEAAISDAADAHMDLQEIVDRHNAG